MPGYATLNTPSNPFNIGNKKQLFLDEMLVQSSKGVKPTLNFPQVPKENLVPQDKPWEEVRVGGFSSVLEHNGAYHFWYTAYGGLGDESRPYSDDIGGPRLHCYTVSSDGIRWEKPSLGLIPFRGSKENNIVMAYVFGQTFVDPFDDEGRRFKMISWMPPKKYGWAALEKIKGRNIYLAYSPDGIHWDLEPEPVLPFYAGAPISTVWDEGLQKWVLYVRVNPKGHKTDPWGSHLAFGRTEVDKHKLAEPYPFTPDPNKKRDEYGSFGNPTYELPVVFEADDRDPDHMVYKMNAVKYPDTDFYISFPGMWYPNVADCDDVEFAFSRDGIHWQRPFRQAIIRLGMPGSCCEGYIDLAEGMIRRGNELWLYYTGWPEHHLAMEVKWDSILARAIYRLDGFISEDGDYDGGELTTYPLIFSGSTLELNLDTSAGGWAYVEIQDESGAPIRGYSLKEADKLNGNAVNMKVSWGAKVDVGALAGKALKVRFVLRNCRLYAFQFR